MKTLIILSVLALAGCLEDSFRYPCQDPANHFKTQCLPPACEASGTCTKYLIKGETSEE
jgi:hypothetical protein